MNNGNRHRNGSKPDPTSNIGKALAALSAMDTIDGREIHRLCGSLCETKAQATALRSELKKRGFVKVLYHVTPAARDRAAKLARAV